AIASIRPAAMAMSARRPSLKVPFLTRMSTCMDPPRSALAPVIGHHERAWIACPPRHDNKGEDGKDVGQHQEDLIGHESAGQLLEAELVGVEGGEEQCAECRLERSPR